MKILIGCRTNENIYLHNYQSYFYFVFCTWKSGHWTLFSEDTTICFIKTFWKERRRNQNTVLLFIVFLLCFLYMVLYLAWFAFKIRQDYQGTSIFQQGQRSDPVSNIIVLCMIPCTSFTSKWQMGKGGIVTERTPAPGRLIN